MQLLQFPMIPHSFSGAVATLVPAAELVIGCMLLLGFKSRIAAILGECMFMIFTFIIVWTIISKRKVACFCFGENDGTISWMTFFRNLFLIVLLAPCLFMNHSAEVGIIANAIFLPIYGLAGMLLFLSIFHLAAQHREVYAKI